MTDAGGAAPDVSDSVWGIAPMPQVTRFWHSRDMSQTPYAPATLPTPETVAARAVGVTKVYGEGDNVVHALAGVTVDFRAGEFTAIMGPSGSGKSTLMHCLAGLDAASGGSVQVGGTELTSLNDKQITQLRRDRIGFVFQSFNLVPTLTAIENITLPLDIAGRKPDEQWLNAVIDGWVCGTGSITGPPSCRAASSSASPAPARSSGGRRSSSATSPPATWIRARAPRCCPSCAPRSTTSGRPSSS